MGLPPGRPPYGAAYEPAELAWGRATQPALRQPTVPARLADYLLLITYYDRLHLQGLLEGVQLGEGGGRHGPPGAELDLVVDEQVQLLRLQCAVRRPASQSVRQSGST